MEGVAIAAAVLGGLGLLFGGVLALADRFLKVEEDPRIEQVERLLPGSNCGACGQPGCRGLAERIVAGELPPSRCTVSSPAGLDAIADFLGVDVGAAEKQVARIHCGGGLGRARMLASYQGEEQLSRCAPGGRRRPRMLLGLSRPCRLCPRVHLRRHADEWLAPASRRRREMHRLRRLRRRLPARADRHRAARPPAHRSVQCAARRRGGAAPVQRRLRRLRALRCRRRAGPRAHGREPPGHRLRRRRPAAPAATYRCPTGAIRWVTGDQFLEDEAPVRSVHV